MNTEKANEILMAFRSNRLGDFTIEEVEALGIAINIIEEKLASNQPKIFDSSAEECQIHSDFKCYSSMNCKGNPQLCEMAVLK